jgi:hypothetical protein
MLSPRCGIAREADPHLGQKISTQDAESLLSASPSLKSYCPRKADPILGRYKTTEIRCAANQSFRLAIFAFELVAPKLTHLPSIGANSLEHRLFMREM